MARRMLPVLCALLIAGCAGTQASRDKPARDAAAPERAWSPRSGMGLNNEPIPPVLAQALQAPYAQPETVTCASLSAAITELDLVLGPDLDSVPANVEEENLALYAVTSGIRGLIPYYGWIRRLSGADRRQRRALAAIAAGHARRGYLKGLGEARGCAPPASPNHSEASH